jgi:hypothetical protein
MSKMGDLMGWHDAVNSGEKLEVMEGEEEHSLPL